MTEQEFLIANVGVNAVIQSKGSTGKTRHVRVDLDGINLRLGVLYRMAMKLAEKRIKET